MREGAGSEGHLAAEVKVHPDKVGGVCWVADTTNIDTEDGDGFKVHRPCPKGSGEPAFIQTGIAFCHAHKMKLDRKHAPLVQSLLSCVVSIVEEGAVFKPLPLDPALVVLDGLTEGETKCHCLSLQPGRSLQLARHT